MNLTLRSAMAALCLLLAVPAAQADAGRPGYARSAVNLRAGPGTLYPILGSMQGGQPVTIYGCTEGYGWCDLDWNGQRGWAAGNYLDMPYLGHNTPLATNAAVIGIPFVVFVTESYWLTNYPHQTFYMDRERYRGHDDDWRYTRWPVQKPHRGKEYDADFGNNGNGNDNGKGHGNGKGNKSGHKKGGVFCPAGGHVVNGICWR